MECCRSCGRSGIREIRNSPETAKRKGVIMENENTDLKSGPGCFWSFLKYNFIWLFLICFCGFLMGAVLYLNNIPAEEIFYGMLLCLFLMVVGTAVMFFRYRSRYLILRKMRSCVTVSLDGLPQTEELTEQEYQAMLRILLEENGRLQEENIRRERDWMEYYTMWVHQIKTPIAALKLLLQEPDRERERDAGEELQELFSIEQYVEMALNWMRLGSDSTDFLFREYALDGIIRQAIRKYAPQFIRRRIRLVYEPAEGKVLTDEKWLLFIIEQLLSNAVKYTQQGSVSIRVVPEKVLEIEDTGIGIAPEDVPRIFEKGFTGYNGRADKKSTGLGLYLCRLTAEKLSHKISVESQVGVGTKVSIDLHSDTLWVE